MSAESIKVCCRFRYERPAEDKSFEEWEFIPEDATIKLKEKTWVYDQILPPEVTQEEMFEKVGKQTITDFTNGFNGTIFAYGQSGSGKTFSMLGPEEVTDSLAKDFKSVPEDVQKLYGITVRAVIQIFETINEGTAAGNVYKLSCSYIEVYNEKIKCLLTKKEDLKIRENPAGGMYVADKEERPCLTPESIFECISLASKNRAVVATNQNSRSSRSHTILLLVIDQVCVDGSKKVSLLNLVDLAGSERIAKTGVEGQALKEAQKINQSLTTLGMCIMALTTPGSKHIPYRNSKLTLLLKESLGGNSKTTLLCTASKLVTHSEESIQTLHFASRAKSIKNACKSNVTLGVKELQYLVDKMKKEILLLRGQIKSSGGIYRLVNDSKVLSMISNEAYEIEGKGEVVEENNEVNNSVINVETISKVKSELKRRRQSIMNLSEEEIIMKYLELKAKYDNMIEAAGNKIHELSNQVSNTNPEKILKSVENETNEKLNKVLGEKDNEINSLREKLESDRKTFDQKESDYLNQIKEIMTQKMIIEDDFNNMKNEKESLENFLELNTSDITALQEKLEKKRNKYRNCKIERNNLKAQLEQKEQMIKELKSTLDNQEKTILEYKITITQLTDQINAVKNSDILASKSQELYSKIKDLEISNLSYNKDIKNLKEEKDLLTNEFVEIKSSLDVMKSANYELKQLKEKADKESEELKKSILEIEKNKNKLKEDLELEKKKMETFVKLSENEHLVKDKKLEDSEIKLGEVKTEIKVLQNSYSKLQKNIQSLELENTLLKKENQLRAQQNNTIKEKVEIKKNIFGVNLLKKTGNIFLKEAKEEAKKTYLLGEELMKDKINELRKLRGNIVSMSPKTISSRSSIGDIMIDFNDEEAFKKQEMLLIEREKKYEDEKKKREDLEKALEKLENLEKEKKEMQEV